jgi:hypothetical protein
MFMGTIEVRIEQLMQAGSALAGHPAILFERYTFGRKQSRIVLT